MLKILHLSKRMDARPADFTAMGFQARMADGPADVERLLTLRNAAFASLLPTGRPWTRAEFDREFSGKRLWLALAASRERQRPEEEVVGAVALGRAGRPPHDKPSLQWLMVAPSHRRRGVGRALIAIVEQAAWDAGDRELALETHADWSDAVRLYERCGYRQTR